MTIPQLNRVTLGRGEDLYAILRSRDNDASDISTVIGKLRKCLEGSFEVDPTGVTRTAVPVYLPPSGVLNDGYSLSIAAAQLDTLDRGNFILDAILTVGVTKKLTSSVLVVLKESASG